MSHKLTEQEFNDRVFKKYYGKVKATEFKNTRERCNAECLICGYKWNPKVSNLLRAKYNECPECHKKHIIRPKNRKPNKRRNEKEVLQEIFDRFPYLKCLGGVFKNLQSEYDWFCENCGSYFKKSLENVLQTKYGCSTCAYKICGENQKQDLDELQKRLDELQPGITYDRSSFITMRKHATFYCPIHGELRTTPDNMLRYGCKYCGHEEGGRKHRSDAEEIAKRIYDIYNGTILLDTTTFIGVIYDGDFECTVCGHHWRNLVASVLHNEAGCPMCSSSKLEKPIYELLLSKMKEDEDFIYDKALADCKMEDSNLSLRPDFLFTKYPLVFELDGISHFLATNGVASLNRTKQRDAFKNNYFKQRNYILIRIASDTAFNKGVVDINKWYTLNKLIELINIGISDNGAINLEVFRPYDFNRTI